RLRRRLAAREQRSIVAEQLGQKRRDAPAVEDGMMEAQAQLKVVVAAPEDEEAHHRRALPVETGAAFLRAPGGDRPILPGGIEVLQILHQDPRLDGLVDALEPARIPHEVKAGAQDGMAHHQSIYRPVESLRVPRAPQAEAEKIVIDGAARVELALEQHSELHLAERVGVFYALGQLLAKLCGDEVERG